MVSSSFIQQVPYLMFSYENQINDIDITLKSSPNLSLSTIQQLKNKLHTLTINYKDLSYFYYSNFNKYYKKNTF